MKRRGLLGMAAAPLLSACDWSALFKQKDISGGYVGTALARGHLLRTPTSPTNTASTDTRQISVAIVGAGIAGLAAARALRQVGISDYRLFELEDTAGGNSRSGAIAGIAHPLGAHYLPTPPASAPEVRELLRELSLLKTQGGKDNYPERTLCHAPQERLLVGGEWQEGLLPAATSARASQQYARFSGAIQAWQQTGGFPIPALNAPLPGALVSLSQQTFGQWLSAQGFDDLQLRWYLNYCCRDDYGAGINTVSAWAGIHYFASRHGFHPPGSTDANRNTDPSTDGVLTWGNGNGWLSERLAAPHQQQTSTAALVTAIELAGNKVGLDVLHTQEARSVRYVADQVIICAPLFIAQKLLQSATTADLSSLKVAAKELHYAPWTVTNIYVPSALRELPGQPRSWDNVVYDGAINGSNSGTNLGYVDAMHQSFRPYEGGATVLTLYSAYGIDPAARKMLYERTWQQAVDQTLAALSVAHPDIRSKARHIDIVRYGHAMAVPTPGIHSSAALAALGKPQTGAAARLHFAHSDLSGYSVFEEAFTWGMRVGARVGKLVSGRA